MIWTKTINEVLLLIKIFAAAAIKPRISGLIHISEIKASDKALNILCVLLAGGSYKQIRLHVGGLQQASELFRIVIHKFFGGNPGGFCGNHIFGGVVIGSGLQNNLV